MTDESEVSCYLCLQADEYGSMLKVSIIPPGFAPRPPLVICRSCGAEVARELWSVLEGENSPVLRGVDGEHESSSPPLGRDINNAIRPDPDLRPDQPNPPESSEKENSE